MFKKLALNNPELNPPPSVDKSRSTSRCWSSCGLTNLVPPKGVDVPKLDFSKEKLDFSNINNANSPNISNASSSSV